MAYNELNVFSTKAGLTRTTVRMWVNTRDIETIDQWMAEGERHPRLAQEAIEQAVYNGDIEIAQKIWMAGWHNPGQTIDAVWNNISSIYSQLNEYKDPLKLARDEKFYHKTIDIRELEAKRRSVVDWVVSKTEETEASLSAKHRNLVLVCGLREAMYWGDEALWDRLLAYKPNLAVAEGNGVMMKVLSLLPIWPNNGVSYSRIPAQWVEDRALPDMLANGLRPGGSLWVAAAQRCPEVLRILLPMAAQITTPRQRSAILAQAGSLMVDHLDPLMECFISLGAPANIKLTPSEAKKPVENYERLYLMDRSYEWNLVKISDYKKERVLQNSVVSLVEVLGDRYTKVVRAKLTSISEGLRGSPPSEPSPKPKM